jgi:hypothetical protein
MKIPFLGGFGKVRRADLSLIRTAPQELIEAVQMTGS